MIQHEYDAVCTAGQRLLATLPDRKPAGFQAPHLHNWPTVSDGVLTSELREVEAALSDLEQAQAAYTTSVSASQSTTLEKGVVLASPLLLTLALALRVTKVSGEIRLAASQKASAGPA
jgi:hypothetical protein